MPYKIVSVSSDNEPLSIIIALTEGEFENISFEVSNIECEDDGNELMVNFEYELLDNISNDRIELFEEDLKNAVTRFLADAISNKLNDE